jgi:hypothetical protein
MSNICKVFDNLHMLWMGRWIHPHAVATTLVLGPDLGIRLNSLTSMVVPIRPLFLGLHNCVLTSQILVLKAILRHRNLAVLFSYNRGILHLHTACHIHDLSRGSVLGYKNHNFI